MERGTVSPVEERRSGRDRRSGVERRAEFGRSGPGHHLAPQPIWLGDAAQRSARAGLSLRRLFPHTAFGDREAADRTAAVEAHRRELSALLGRNAGFSVAGLDYLLNISHELVAPTIVERAALEILQHRSVTDPLTGLFNRYHFDAALKREIARCVRYQVRLCLVLLDVDQLKAVNDRWGHQAGDRVLSRVADAIQYSLRQTDIPSRHGGDEFAIILPDTDARAGRLVAERIRTNVGASLGTGSPPEAAIAVTVSEGLAELSPAAPHPSDAQLILAADQALYVAKGQGGNCVAEAAPNPGTTSDK